MKEKKIHFILGSNCIFPTELTKFCYSKTYSKANEALGPSWQSNLLARLVHRSHDL